MPSLIGKIACEIQGSSCETLKFVQKPMNDLLNLRKFLLDYNYEQQFLKHRVEFLVKFVKYLTKLDECLKR